MFQKTLCELVAWNSDIILFIDTAAYYVFVPQASYLLEASLTLNVPDAGATTLELCHLAYQFIYGRAVLEILPCISRNHVVAQKLEWGTPSFKLLLDGPGI